MIFIAAPYSVWLWLYDIMDYKKCLYLVSDGTVRRPYELFFSCGVATVTRATHATVWHCWRASTLSALFEICTIVCWVVLRHNGDRHLGGSANGGACKRTRKRLPFNCRLLSVVMCIYHLTRRPHQFTHSTPSFFTPAFSTPSLIHLFERDWLTDWMTWLTEFNEWRSREVREQINQIQW